MTSFPIGPIVINPTPTEDRRAMSASTVQAVRRKIGLTNQTIETLRPSPLAISVDATVPDGIVRRQAGTVIGGGIGGGPPVFGG